MKAQSGEIGFDCQTSDTTSGAAEYSERAPHGKQEQDRGLVVVFCGVHFSSPVSGLITTQNGGSVNGF